MEIQTRPWLGPEGDQHDAKLGWDIPGRSPTTKAVDFSIDINNFGHSPAQQVRTGQYPSPMLRASENKVACQRADQNFTTDAAHPRLLTIFPGHTKTILIKGAVPDETLAVCIAYLGASDTGTIHHTLLTYRPSYFPGDKAGEVNFVILLQNSEID